MTKKVLENKYNWIIIIASMLIASVILNAQLARAEKEPIKNPDVLINAVPVSPWTFDPVFAYYSSDMEVLSSCYDTLIAYHRERTDIFRPRLATQIPSTKNGGISPDGLTYRFTIRNDVVFSNGLPLTAEDVEYTFERAMVRDPEYSYVFILLDPLLGVYSTRDGAGGFTVTFEDIDNAVEVEENDVIFHLAKPFAPFMHLLATWYSSVVSKQWCIAHGDWPGTAEAWQDYNNLDVYSSPLHAETMGTGPFKLECWIPEVEVVLARNDLYWRDPARLEQVVFKEVSDPIARAFMLMAGDVDFCDILPNYLYPELDAAEGIRAFKDLPKLTMFYLSFNRAILPSSPYIGTGLLDGNGIPPDFFSDIDVRKAFAYAFDYASAITDRWGGEALQPASAVVDGLPFHNPDQPKYTNDLSKAQEHFENAWEGQVWKHGFTFSLSYLNLGWKSIAEMLKANIESLNPNFHLELVQVPWWEIYYGRLPTWFSGWGVDYPDPHSFVSPLMHSGGLDAALTGYNNPFVDYLIDAGVSTTDPAGRQAIYYELQSLYHDEVIAIPIAQPIARHYQRDWVQGWYYNPGAFTDYYSIYKAIEDKQ